MPESTPSVSGQVKLWKSHGGSNRAYPRKFKRFCEWLANREPPWSCSVRGGRPAKPRPRQRHRLQGGVHAELAPGVVQVRVNGFQGHVQLLGHLTQLGAL